VISDSSITVRTSPVISSVMIVMARTYVTSY